MKEIFRAIAALFAAVATIVFLYIPFSMIRLGSLYWVGELFILACAVLAGWVTWKVSGKSQEGLAKHVVIGAATLGGIGFCGGFFGPIIFAPEANQGPLLGIFITGPLGFALGAVGGLVYWLMNLKKAKQIPSPQRHEDTKKKK